MKEWGYPVKCMHAILMKYKDTWLKQTGWAFRADFIRRRFTDVCMVVLTYLSASHWAGKYF
jgi:hypothetical protein